MNDDIPDDIEPNKTFYVTAIDEGMDQGKARLAAIKFEKKRLKKEAALAQQEKDKLSYRNQFKDFTRKHFKKFLTLIFTMVTALATSLTELFTGMISETVKRLF